MASLSPQLIGIGAYNEASISNYPIVDDASLRDTQDQISLPRDLIVDLMLPLPLPETYNASLFHISEVGVHGSWILIRIGYDGTDVAEANIPVDNHETYNSYFVRGTSPDFEDVSGRITIGFTESMLEQSGVFRFNRADTNIRPTLLIPMLRGVRTIQPVNQGEVDSRLTGDIQLTAGTNIRITPNGNTLTLDAIDGEGLTDQCECTDVRELPPAIRRISGVAPTTDGDFLIQGTECISVSGTNQGVALGDECATPCCGSEELQVLQNDQDDLNEDVRTLNNMLQQLETRLVEVEQVKSMIEASGLVSF